MKRVLFVCTGNTCRSPMAEGMFRKLVESSGDYEVQSAGVGAYPGDAMSPHTASLLRAAGALREDFRSQPLSPDLVRQATHIFALSRSHLMSLEAQFPEAMEKAYLVSEFSADDALRDQDVSDPFGQDASAYRRTWSTLEKLLPTIQAYIDQTFDKSKP